MNSKRHATLSVFNNKSSVLCPSTTHITSQYLALEQLKAHHNMVSHAKGTIDTSAPKSCQSYLSSIDRKKKSFWQDGRLSSQSALLEDLSHTLRLQKERQFTTEEHDSKIMVGHDDTYSTSLNKSIQAGIPFPHFQSKVADKISWYLEAVSQGVFQDTSRNGPRNTSRQSGSLVSLSSSLRSGKVVKGDLMDWHKKSFTAAPRPFSPRILANNNAKSKVSGMRCYNPPRKRKERGSINSSEESTFESYDEEEEQDQESEREDKDEKVDDDVEEINEEEEVIEEIKTEEHLAEEVPIRGGSTHREWLSEQALRAQIRRKLSTKASTLRSANVKGFDGASSKRESNDTLLTRTDEEKYLKFLSGITEDILRSGIYSDNAIQRTFDFHLQFCSSEAEKEKMKQLLHQVLEGLRVPCEDQEDSNPVLTSCSEDHIRHISTPLKQETTLDGSVSHLSSNLEEATAHLNNALATNAAQNSLQREEEIGADS